MKNKFHNFHIIEQNPWPLISALSILIITSSATIWFQFYSSLPIRIAILATIIRATQWWRDTIRESLIQGEHNLIVTKGLKIGIILFITSEILFFTSFFWSYFHNRTRPNIEIGQIWPPTQIHTFNPINIPLLNTILLLSSGVTVTWSHHTILENKIKKRINRLLITCLLGIYFSTLQAFEYIEAQFTIRDRAYGSTFFIATGFHGIHVLIGTTFLLIILIRNNILNSTKSHIIGFEIAAWYWHFVDIVWLYLYSSLYWWGN